MSKPKYPETDIYMNWRPEDARHAFSIYDRGGPLVDFRTGRVIILAPMSGELWSQLVDLPEGAWLEGRPITTTESCRADFAAAAKAAWKQALVPA